LGAAVLQGQSSKLEKQETGKPSIPRPEIDLLALNLRDNEVIALELKSFLDSPGVKLQDLQKVHQSAEGRYKLFTSASYRTIVFRRLMEQLLSQGMINAKTKLTLGLAAGKVYQAQSVQIKAFMTANGWFFGSPEDIKEKVTALAKHGYSNNAAVITAKILVR
jgi:hypothetical protein